MKKEIIAVCLQELGSNPDTVQLFPLGEFRAVDGRPRDAAAWHLSPESAASLQQRLSRRKTPLVIDYEHQTLHATKNGKPAPAAGWFRGIDVREDGVFAADVRWTAKAKKMIAEDEYRYISPVFMYQPESGEITQLLHAALTNSPALDGMHSVIAAATQFYSDSDEAIDMTIPGEILTALNLADTATAEQAVSAITALHTTVTRLQAEQAAMQSDRDQALAAVATAAPDPAKYVPAEAVEALRTELAAIRSQQMEDQINTLVQAALADGRILPPMEEWARTLGRSNLASLQQYIEKAQPIAALTQMQTKGKGPDAEEDDHSEPDEQRWEKQWNRSAALRAEFADDRDAFMAYQRADKRGLISMMKRD